MSNSVPQEWKEFCLKDLSEVITKGTTPTTGGAGYAQSGIKFFRVENISRSGFIEEQDLKFISQETHDSLKRSQLKVGDLLVSIAGAIGRSAIVGKNNVPANTNQAVGIVRLRKNEVITEFVRYSIESPMVAKQLRDAQSGNAQINLNLEQLGSLRFYRPPLPEQQKIATILSSVDGVIEKTRAQIDKLKDLKTGMMQELLTKGIGSGGAPHTEFKDSPVGRIPMGWDVKQLNEIATIKHGYAFEGEFFSTTPTPHTLLTPGNFNRDGRLYFGPKTKYFGGPIPSEYILKNGDVLVVMTDLTKEMTILGNTIILQSTSTVLHNQRIGKVELTEEDVITQEYLCFVMNSGQIKTHIKDTATGTTVRHTSPTKILEPFIPVPTMLEQKKIMACYQSLDARLSATERKLASSLKIKNALMQDLLTGKVRVNITESAALENV